MVWGPPFLFSEMSRWLNLFPVNFTQLTILADRQLALPSSDLQLMVFLNHEAFWYHTYSGIVHLSRDATVWMPSMNPGSDLA